MRHVNYILRPVTIDNAKPREKAYALTDGGGLLLEVLPSGTKTWRFKYHLNGKREKVTIGAYPAFTIKQARDRHEELRALVERGESPAKLKQAAAAERKLADERRVTFRAFAQRWIEETLFYRSSGYVAQIVRWLDAYVNPTIGDMPLGDVQPGDVLAIIKAQGPQRRDRRAHPRDHPAGLQPRDPQPAGDDEPGAAAARRHRARAGQTSPALEREATRRILAQARRPGCAHHDDRGDAAAALHDDAQERIAALEVARV